MKSAKGNTPKRPPLTFDAKQALSAATEGFWKVAHEVDGLKEPSLKGFAFEARERAASDPDFEFLYRALAEMAERRLAILRRRRRERGIGTQLSELPSGTGTRPRVKQLPLTTNSATAR